MKRQTQTTGVRYWFGSDYLSMQEEAFKILDGFFGQFGPHVLMGCQVTPRADKYDVAPGIVVMEGLDAEGRTAKMIVPFAGVSNVALPIYLTITSNTESRIYKDGGVKPIVHNYKATASTVKPAGSCVAITATATLRFVDIIQDAQHRFLTDAERAAWNGKENTGVAEQKSQAALTAAQKYADGLISDLIDNSPETLDTFKELAAALGNDPNFATTIFTRLGQKVDIEEGKGLSTNDFTNEDKQFLAGLKYYDYVVDSNEKLAGLINNPNAVNVLIKSGWWRYSGTIELHPNTRHIYGEVGSVLAVRGFGYTNSRSLDRDYCIDGVCVQTPSAMPDDSWRGFINMKNMMRCRVGVLGSNSVAFSGCINLMQCWGFGSAAAFSDCTRLYQCEGESNSKSFDGCYDVVQCVGNAPINSCYGVFQCRATGFTASYFSPTSNSVHACAATLNGGWNTTIRV